MRSPVRRALSWALASAIVVGGGVAAWQAFAPDEPGGASTRPAVTTSRPATTAASDGTTVSAPTSTEARPATSRPRSPVPEVDVAAVGELVSLNAGSTAGRTPVGVLASAQVLPSAFVSDAGGVPRQNRDLLASVEVSAGPPQSVVYGIAEAARWSDGTPITCDDFRLAWIAGRGDTGQDGTPLFANAVAGYDAVSQMTCSGPSVTVVFDRPNPAWQLLFSSLVPSHVVLQAKGLQAIDLDRGAQGEPLTLIALAQGWNDAYVVARGMPTVSGGPFVPTELVPGERLVLSRNPTWWGAPPTLDRIVLRLFPDAAGALAALARNEVQVVGTPLSAAEAAQAATVPEARVETQGGAVFDHLVVNFRNPLFQDRQVREALAQCTPRDRIAGRLADLGEGTGIVLDHHLLVPFQTQYRPHPLGPAAFDVAQARATLERDGWRRGGDGVFAREGKRFAFRLLHEDTPRAAEVALAVVNSCGDAGIDVAAEAVPTSERDDRARTGEFDLLLTSNRVRLSPTGAQVMFGTRGSENLGDYSSSAVDALFIGLAGVLDPATQDEVVERIDALLWADLPTLPLTQPAVRIAVRSNLTGVVLNPTVAGLLWNAEVWVVTPA